MEKNKLELNRNYNVIVKGTGEKYPVYHHNCKLINISYGINMDLQYTFRPKEGPAFTMFPDYDNKNYIFKVVNKPARLIEVLYG